MEFYLPRVSSEKNFRLQLAAAAASVAFAASVTSVYLDQLLWPLHVVELQCCSDCSLTLSSAAARCTDVINTCSCPSMDFMVAPGIGNIKHFIVQLMHTNYKIIRLLKYLKL